MVIVPYTRQTDHLPVQRVPSSLVAVRADVVKKRLNLGLAETPAGAIRQVIRERNGSVRGLFIGWQANLMKVGGARGAHVRAGSR